MIAHNYRITQEKLFPQSHWWGKGKELNTTSFYKQWAESKGPRHPQGCTWWAWQCSSGGGGWRPRSGQCGLRIPWVAQREDPLLGVHLGVVAWPLWQYCSLAQEQKPLLRAASFGASWQTNLFEGDSQEARDWPSSNEFSIFHSPQPIIFFLPCSYLLLFNIYTIPLIWGTHSHQIHGDKK